MHAIPATVGGGPQRQPWGWALRQVRLLLDADVVFTDFTPLTPRAISPALAASAGWATKPLS